MAVNMLADAFELRILSGLHKGARAALPNGANVVIGAAEGCDFILRDAGIPAQLLRLQQQGGAWMLQWLTASGQADASTKEIVLPRDKAVSLATRKGEKPSDTPVLAVQPASMPWPGVLPSLIAKAVDQLTDPTLDFVENKARADAGDLADIANGKADSSPDAQHHQPGNQAARLEPALASAAKPAALAAGLDALAPPVSSTTSKAVRLIAWLVIAIALLVIAYLVFGWLQRLSTSQTAPIRPAATGLPAQIAEPLNPAKSRAAIAAIAAELKLQSRIKIDNAENGQAGLLVRAGPLTDEETEALAAALSRLSPRPGLRVVSEFALREAVQEAVAKLGAARNTQLVVKPLAVGRFEIQGRLPENADREAVMAALQTEFADLAVFESALLTSPDMAAKMVEELQKTGIALVQGQWQTGKLLLQAQMPRANLPQWEAALSRIAARFALPFTATLSWTAANPLAMALQKSGNSGANARSAGSNSDPRLQPGLPFALQSIVGGATPYVVTADGGKLLPGGSYRGWRLVDISAQRVLFEGDAGAAGAAGSVRARRVEVRR